MVYSGDALKTHYSMDCCYRRIIDPAEFCLPLVYLVLAIELFAARGEVSVVVGDSVVIEILHIGREDSGPIAYQRVDLVEDPRDFGHSVEDNVEMIDQGFVHIRFDETCPDVAMNPGIDGGCCLGGLLWQSSLT